MQNPSGLEQKRPKSNPQKKKQQNPGIRPGDWICVNCQNFNFSFRTECNRCKVLTKQQNSQVKPCQLKLKSKKEKIESNEKILSKKSSVDSSSTKCSVSSNLKMQFDAINFMCKQYNQVEKNQNFEKPTPSVSPLLRKFRSHNNSFSDLDLVEIQEESLVVDSSMVLKSSQHIIINNSQDDIFDYFHVKKQGNVAKSSNLEQKIKRNIFMRKSYAHSIHQENSKNSESGKSFKELQKSIERQNCE